MCAIEFVVNNSTRPQYIFFVGNFSFDSARRIHLLQLGYSVEDFFINFFTFILFLQTDQIKCEVLLLQ